MIKEVISRDFMTDIEYRKYDFDTRAEAASLPTATAKFSDACCLEDGSGWKLNGSGVWTELPDDPRKLYDALCEIEIQTHVAKNTLINTESAKVKIARPARPAKYYKISMINPSVDSDLDVKLWNRRTFRETGTAILAGSDGTHIQLSAQAKYTDDYYNNFEITITKGTGAGQKRTISDYVGATQIATVSAAWATALDATSEYSIAIVRDALAYTLTVPKAVITGAPVVLATDGAVFQRLFDDMSDVYYSFVNKTAIADADASRFTAIFKLIPIM